MCPSFGGFFVVGGGGGFFWGFFVCFFNKNENEIYLVPFFLNA